MIRILLIEDEPIARSMASGVLEHLKFQFEVAESGHEALDFIQKNHYMLILCDLGLPDMTGFEIARRIRNEANLNQTTPIFALTSHGDEKHRERALQSGMTGFLAKPLDERHCLAVAESIQNL